MTGDLVKAMVKDDPKLAPAAPKLFAQLYAGFQREARAGAAALEMERELRADQKKLSPEAFQERLRSSGLSDQAITAMGFQVPLQQAAKSSVPSIPARAAALFGPRQAPATAVSAAPADPRVEAAGQQLDAARRAAEFTRANLQQFGLRQQRDQPQEFALARAARESALRDLQAAQQAYESVVGGGQTGPGFGALQRP